MTKKQTKQPDSSAYQLLHHVWNHANESMPHSWERLNHGMRSVLRLAIYAGLRFAKNDFQRIADDFRFVRWGGMENGGFAESFYTLAVVCGNQSAIVAFETWKKRPAFIVDQAEPPHRYDDREGMHLVKRRKRSRVAIGFTFPWRGENVEVTSFTEDGSALIAVTRVQVDKYRYKVAKRFRITPADLKVEPAGRKAKAKEASK